MVQPCAWDVGSGTSPVDDQIPLVSPDLWFSHLRNGDNFNKPTRVILLLPLLLSHLSRVRLCVTP